MRRSPATGPPRRGTAHILQRRNHVNSYGLHPVLWKIVPDILRGKWKRSSCFQLAGTAAWCWRNLEPATEAVPAPNSRPHLLKPPPTPPPPLLPTPPPPPPTPPLCGNSGAFGLIGKIEPDGLPVARDLLPHRARERLLQAVADHAGYRRGRHAGERQAGILERKGIILPPRANTHKKVTTVLSATCPLSWAQLPEVRHEYGTFLFDRHPERLFPAPLWENCPNADEAAAQATGGAGAIAANTTGPVSHVRHINTRPGAAFFLPDTRFRDTRRGQAAGRRNPSSSNTRRTLFSNTILLVALSRGIRKSSSAAE